MIQYSRCLNKYNSPKESFGLTTLTIMKRITLTQIFFLSVVVCSSLLLLISSPNKDETKKKEKAGPELQRKYFEHLHYPYGAVLDPGMLSEIWSEVSRTKIEYEVFSPSTTWTLMGPYGTVFSSNGVRFTGRVIDLNIRDTGNVLIAAASGGLWAPGNPPVPLTEQITSQAAGSFDSQPGNGSVMLLGTGEPQIRGGTGLFRTSDGGANWTNISMSDTMPGTFYRIRFSSQTVVHAATDRGYFRSQDAGLTWSRYLRGDITDVAFNPVNTSILLCARWQHNDADSGGVYKSNDGGNTWSRVSNGIPVTDVGRTSISICRGNPNFVYTLMAKRNHEMKGVYRSANGGDFWTAASPGEDILEGIGWYSNEIAVSPTSIGTVLAGGVYLWRTTNLGLNWYKITHPHVHADQHSIEWGNDGNSVWVGNDGGVIFSSDAGLNFSSSNNRYPITQYYNIDDSPSNPDIVMGGSQDNGISFTTDGGTTWRHNTSWGGDGSGVTINPFDPAEFYWTLGVYSGNWPFPRHRSTDYGQTWTRIDNGIEPTSQWWNRIKTDNASPVTLYTNQESFLYYSTNRGDNWFKRNTTAFGDWVSNFSVRKYGDTALTYVCTFSVNTGQRLYLQTGSGNFIERSGDFLDGLKIGAIGMHPTNSSIAYAVVIGLYSAHKVYKTTNRGTNWTNITNNLPNVPATDIVVNPNDDDVLYLGTEMGCFKTTSGGTNWFRWNDGLPQAAIITQLKTYTTTEGLFVLAGTYGRSVWTRQEDSPVGIGNITEGLPKRFELKQNYPNPFNVQTKIQFSIPPFPQGTSLRKGAREMTRLVVYDILGREVAVLVNQVLNSGSYEVHWDASNFPSGVYFYTMAASDFSDVKRMILIK